MARSSSEVDFRSAESHLSVLCSSDTIVLEEIDQLQSNQTSLEDQCKLEALHGVCTRNLLNSASATSQKSRK